MIPLIQMRHQIQAIESIKKITKAMRLISMSAHNQLGNRLHLMQNYKNELIKTLNIVINSDNTLKKNILNTENAKPNTLIIVVGSQKGLTGTFNSSLFHLLIQNLNSDFSNKNFITVGKKATEFVKKHSPLIAHYDQFTIQNFSNIAANIFDIIMNSKPFYTNVILYSNFPKSFFTQLPQENILLPLAKIKLEDSHLNNENYVWEDSIQNVYEYLLNEFLHFSIQSLLFNSLLAEHSARFKSMDNATRNAEELLDTLKLQYNKIRQTKITSEITELSSTI